MSFTPNTGFLISSSSASISNCSLPTFPSAEVASSSSCLSSSAVAASTTTCTQSYPPSFNLALIFQDGILIECKGPFQDILGHQPKEFLSKEYKELQKQVDSDCQQDFKEMLECKKSDPSKLYIIRFLHPHYYKHCIYLSCHAQRINTEQSSLLVVSAVDLTELLRNRSLGVNVARNIAQPLSMALQLPEETEFDEEKFNQQIRKQKKFREKLSEALSKIPLGFDLPSPRQLTSDNTIKHSDSFNFAEIKAQVNNYKSVPDLWFALNLDSLRLIGISDACSSMLGYDSKELLDSVDEKTVYKFILESDHKLLDENIKKRRKGIPGVVVIRVLDKNKRARCLGCVVTPNLIERILTVLATDLTPYLEEKRNRMHEARNFVASIDIWRRNMKAILLSKSYTKTEKYNLLLKLTTEAKQLLDDAIAILDAQTTIEFVANYPIPFDVAAYVKTLAAVPIPTPKEIKIVLDQKNPQEGIFLLDRMQFMKIIFNVLSNAIKYTNTGTITISWMNQNNDLEFKFVDTGCGMREDELAHVFDLYYRTTSAKSSDQPGQGLGVPIVKRIVEAMGGKIFYASMATQENHGTTVTIQIPDQKRFLSSVAKSSKAPSVPDFERVTMSTAEIKRLFLSWQLTVVVVDDNKQILRFYDQFFAPYLKYIKYEKFNQGLEAVAAVKRYVAAGVENLVVITDIEIPPGISGYAVARMIRDLPGAERFLIIAASGGDECDHLYAASLAGINYYLIKPIPPQKLIKVIVFGGEKIGFTKTKPFESKEVAILSPNDSTNLDMEDRRGYMENGQVLPFVSESTDNNVTAEPRACWNFWSDPESNPRLELQGSCMDSNCVGAAVAEESKPKNVSSESYSAAFFC
jgi:CheY-like chemotaxis protein